TWQYNDACQNIYLFCDPASNKCNYIGCTNTDYVKGWNTNIRPFPARCGNGTFCPDNLSHCTNTLPTGAACEMQRDDECQGVNSICLNGFCNIKAVPLGGKCGNDTTQYVSYDAEGYAELQTIVRDNCTDGTYCVNEACVKAKDNGAACDQDRECISETCGSDGYCIMGPDVFHAIATWLWGVLGAAVVIFMIIILLLLWALQRYQSKKEKLKVRKFFGDNEEFAKYAMLDDDSLYDDTAQLQPPASLNEKNRASMVYLTTPDYSKSSALSVGGHHHDYYNNAMSTTSRSPSIGYNTTLSSKSLSILPPPPSSSSPTTTNNNTSQQKHYSQQQPYLYSTSTSSSTPPPPLPPSSHHIPPSSSTASPKMDDYRPHYYTTPYDHPPPPPPSSSSSSYRESKMLNKLREYNDIMNWMDNEFWEQNEEVYQEKLQSLQKELKSIQDDIVSDLEIIRDQTIQNALCFEDYQLLMTRQELELNTMVIEEEYQNEMDHLNEVVMSVIDEHRRQIKEDREYSNKLDIKGIFNDAYAKIKHKRGLRKRTNNYNILNSGDKGSPRSETTTSRGRRLSMI
ncbi:hypothetical protein BJ944DRAFT_158133, partial [Cunninghamella echinulata]